MITYVDTSTSIKLIVDEEGSERAELIWQTTDSVASVSLIVVEARAALAAAARGKRLSPTSHTWPRQSWPLSSTIFILSRWPMN